MGVQIRRREEVILMGESGRPSPAVEIRKATQQTAEPVQCGFQFGCTRWSAYWRNLANTIELSMCDRDSALGLSFMSNYFDDALVLFELLD